MKIRIAFASAAALLTLTSAVSSSTPGLLRAQSVEPAPSPEALSGKVTPEMIASWRVTAYTRDYVASKRPI